jgi:hypothetical protein
MDGQRRDKFFKILGNSVMIHDVVLIGSPGMGKTSTAIRVVDKLTGGNGECYEVTTVNALWFRRILVGGESGF